MIVIDTSTGKELKVDIELVEEKELKTLSKKRYFFDWKQEKNYEIYKLVIEGTNDILGLISIERILEEWRIHIRLITVSVENKGRDKKFDRITGNLITYISKMAVEEHSELACVSLRPKGAIAQHYIKKYNMNITGMTLSAEINEIMQLINTYDHE
jgi:hypothetical protein